MNPNKLGSPMCPPCKLRDPTFRSWQQKPTARRWELGERCRIPTSGVLHDERAGGLLELAERDLQARVLPFQQSFVECAGNVG